MTIGELIERLSAMRERHADVEVLIAGAERGEGELPPPVLSVHTADWVERADGEPVVVYLDVTG